jgi:branched-chain amino acid aminotransferase
MGLGCTLTYVYLNNRLVPETEAVVSVFDHGFLYGDGVYETMRAYRGVVFMLGEHIERLGRSASMIGLDIGRGPEGIKDAVYETLRENRLTEAYVRLTVSRGPGALGLDPDLCKEPTFIVMAMQFKEYPAEIYTEGVRLRIARIRRNLREALDPRIKSLNFLNNVLAKAEARRAGAFEALMLNHRGALAECTVSNIFFVSRGVLKTPSVECGILDGITRGVVMGLARAEGMAVEEGEYLPDDLYSADEAFITNTTLEAAPVGAIDGRRLAAGPVARRLREAYRAEVARYVEATGR